MNLPFGIQQSTLAGGLAGVLAWGAGIALASAGIIVPPAVLTPICIMIVTAVVHLVPDAAKIDKEIKDIAAQLPGIDPTYPGNDGKPPVSEQAWKNKD